MTTALVVCGVLCACLIAVIAIVIREDLRDSPDPYDFDFDDHADEAIALLGDDFGLWEKELTIR